MDPVAAPVSKPHSSSSEPQIRHAGRAHVRGKIRRVWRPRYLELWDNGWVRYYEEDEGRIRIHRYTLMIFQARILDATTFRDMHVGLPTSTYGFMFRGQRLLPVESELMQCHPEGGQPEPRDFLCAVASLEEAQTWVVALQWAVSQNSMLAGSRASPSTDPWWTPSSPLLSFSTSSRSTAWEPVREEEEGMMGVRVLESCTLEPPVALDSSLADTPSRFRDLPSTGNRGMADSGLKGSPISSPHLNSGRHRVATAAGGKRSGNSKIMVSRVVQYRAVRLRKGFKFDIAYEIRVLLLQRRQQAEQWSLLRTADDFRSLFGNLKLHADDSRIRSIQQIPRLSDRPTREDLQASLSIVDSLMRSLVMDAKAVNSSALKAFLGVGSATKVGGSVPPLLVRWWEGHDGKSVLTDKDVVKLNETVSTDQFVKDWLKSSSVAQSEVDARAAQALQIGSISNDKSPFSSPSKTTLIFATAVVPLTSRLWRHYIPTFTVRLDILVLSWAASAYIGSVAFGSNAIPSISSAKSPTKDLSSRKQSKDHAKVANATQNTTTRRGEFENSDTPVEDDGDESDGDEAEPTPSLVMNRERLSSPLPKYPTILGHSCWCQPDSDIFHVRGATYLSDKIKVPSDDAPLTCRGVDVWMTDNPQRHIARHPSVLGGKLAEEDTFLVNFLLPFGNLVAYFSIPAPSDFPPKLHNVWNKFKQGDQEYRDARLKLLPVVVEGPWIVKAAVGPGKSPALLGKVIPLQYFFRDADDTRKGVYEVDVIITASSIAKGILSVVKGHTKSVSIAFAFIVEGTNADELPETVLSCFQLNSLHLENCPILPNHTLGDISYTEQ